MNKKYSICYNSSIDNAVQIIKKLSLVLESYELEYEIYDVDNISSNADFAFVIGGDGTILKAARYFAKSSTPVLGINLGHLGFLSQATDNELDLVVKKVKNEQYITQNRMMLESDNYLALNDFVVKGEEISRASSFSLEINNEFVCDYFADGVIISTPTGSTAYGMASGGPILTPELDAVAIIPICPHTLNARPIVIKSDSVIKIISHNKQNNCVVADGQNVFSFMDNICIKKSDKVAKLVLLSNDFYSVLRDKLQWGINPTKK